jgi:Uma2 family endonuclease
MQAASQKSDPQLHLWTRAEYHQMAEAGIFQNRRVQLIEGQVVEMSPVAEAGRSPLTSRHANDLLEVYRDPSQNSESVYGFSYASKSMFTSQDSIVPLNFPDVVIQVKDLLP